jgi:hypothetical protein
MGLFWPATDIEVYMDHFGGFPSQGPKVTHFEAWEDLKSRLPVNRPAFFEINLLVCNYN